MELNKQQANPHHVTPTMKWLLLIFVAILIGVLWYLIQVTYSQPSQETTVKTKKTTTTKTTTTNPTADWKTYTNALFNFSFKYPPTFKVTDKLQTSATDTALGTNTLAIEDTAVSGKPSLTLYVNPAGFDGTPTNLLYNLTANNDGTLTIGTKEDQKIEIGAFGYDGTRQIAGTNIAGMKIKDKTFVIRFTYDTGKETLLTTFDNILKSFKVTK
jgi:hypothetical protein